MEVLSLKFITTACGGARLSGRDDIAIQSVCTDSRQARAGDLFLALSGDRFDGHDFVVQAVAKGAAAVVLERNRIPDTLPACPVIAVDNTRQSLGLLAAEYRRRFNLPIIAVAGSNGKTTTKELIASVLRQKLTTLWSEASFNNNIGVPLTLLRLEKQHQAAILETGTNHPGELAPLVRMVQPGLGVITNIGREHLEFFGDLEGVAEEEGSLARLLPADGKLFMHGDSQWTPRIAGRTRAAVVRVGLSPGNDWLAQDIRPDKQGASFTVTAPQSLLSGVYRINLLGRHQVLNALFAIAVGAELGLDRAEIERGLAACTPPPMRLQLGEHNGVRVLNDAYNANADSMLAALQTMRDLPCKGRRIAVLGDMAELGAHAEAAHQEAGRLVAECGIGQLFVVGTMAAVTARAARAAGLHRVLEFTDVDSAAAAVKSFVKAGDLLLLKASRAGRLERIAEILKTKEP
jgi:UDP-N-acetylmuramoyl-tripeptide--D-alanyl-D-alanine ligase